MTRREDTLPRRQIIELGAGAALLILPEACSSGSSPPMKDASVVDVPKDVPLKDVAMEAAPPCKTDFVDAGGSCAQSDQTAAVNILKAGISSPGTSYEFSDCRFVDVNCCDSAIIVIHPMTGGGGYVALSGACPHMCCDQEGNGPTYLPSCILSIDDCISGGWACNADAGAPDCFDAGADAAPAPDGGYYPGKVLHDILFCTCHGSIFNALNGDNISGPAGGVGLQKLDTCEAGGFVFITIPKPTVP